MRVWLWSFVATDISLGSFGCWTYYREIRLKGHLASEDTRLLRHSTITMEYSLRRGSAYTISFTHCLTPASHWNTSARWFGCRWKFIETSKTLSSYLAIPNSLVYSAEKIRWMKNCCMGSCIRRTSTTLTRWLWRKSWNSSRSTISNRHCATE